jgi:hypothetical protein
MRGSFGGMVADSRLAIRGQPVSGRHFSHQPVSHQPSAVDMSALSGTSTGPGVSPEMAAFYASFAGISGKKRALSATFAGGLDSVWNSFGRIGPFSATSILCLPTYLCNSFCKQAVSALGFSHQRIA